MAGFRAVEFEEKFTPDIELETRSGSKYLIDTAHGMVQGGRYCEEPTKLYGANVLERDGNFVLQLQNPKEVEMYKFMLTDPTTIGKGIRLETANGTFKISQIMTARIIPSTELMQSSSERAIITTRSGSEYVIDVDHKLISGGHLGNNPVPYTQIGCCMGRDSSNRPKDFEDGVGNIRPDKGLAVYLKNMGWLTSSAISKTHFEYNDEFLIFNGKNNADSHMELG